MAIDNKDKRIKGLQILSISIIVAFFILFAIFVQRMKSPVVVMLPTTTVTPPTT